ncbi:MAG: sensor domain-containing diguanylate cyclase [Thermaerobacter sp.]|nr:sensor domain-containing diguanylate cyclase [Thermaerobacter sp.]
MELDRFLSRLGFHRIVFGLRLTLWAMAGLLSLSEPWTAVVWLGFALVMTIGMALVRDRHRLALWNQVMIPVDFVLITLAVRITGGLASAWYLFYGGEALFLTAYGTVLWAAGGAVLVFILYGWSSGQWTDSEVWFRSGFFAIFFITSGLLGEVIRLNSRRARDHRKKFERLAQMKVLQESIIHEQKLDVVLNAMVYQGLQMTHVVAGYVALLAEDGHWQPAAFAENAPGVVDPAWVIPWISGMTIPKHMAIVELSDEIPAPQRCAIRYAAICPLREDGTDVGVVIFCAPSRATLEEHTLSIEVLAGMMVAQVRFHRTRDMAAHRGNLLKLFEQVGRLLNRSLDMSTLLRDLHQAVAEILEIDGFYVALALAHNPTHALMRYVYDDGKSYPQEVIALEPGGITADVLKTGEPRICVGAPATAQLGGSMKTPRGVMIVPLIHEGRVIGAMSAQSYRVEYNPEHLEFLSAIASQASGALRNAQLYQQTQEVALTDPLTGLGNSRHFNVTLQEHCERADRLQQPLSLLLIDSDSLKVINDHYGHMAGDAHLQLLADTIRSSIREGDTACRYAGDEFVVILPASRIDDALAVGERIRLTMDQAFSWDGNLTLMTTISVGAAEYTPGTTAEYLFAQADYAMYQAKQHGKNRVVAS